MQRSYHPTVEGRVLSGMTDDLRQLLRTAEEVQRRLTILRAAIVTSGAGEDQTALIDSMTDRNSLAHYGELVDRCESLRFGLNVCPDGLLPACKDVP